MTANAVAPVSSLAVFLGGDGPATALHVTIFRNPQNNWLRGTRGNSSPSVLLSGAIETHGSRISQRTANLPLR